MSKHTPGPWYAKRTAGHDRHGQSAVHGDDGRDVAIVYDGDSNANVIAAAPELLEALKALLAYADAYSDKMREIGRGAEELGEGADSVSVSGMARAAIAKAEGKSHE